MLDLEETQALYLQTKLLNQVSSLLGTMRYLKLMKATCSVNKPVLLISLLALQVVKIKRTKQPTVLYWAQLCIQTVIKKAKIVASIGKLSKTNRYKSSCNTEEVTPQLCLNEFLLFHLLLMTALYKEKSVTHSQSEMEAYLSMNWVKFFLLRWETRKFPLLRSIV